MFEIARSYPAILFECFDSAGVTGTSASRDCCRRERAGRCRRPGAAEADAWVDSACLLSTASRTGAEHAAALLLSRLLSRRLLVTGNSPRAAMTAAISLAA